MFKIEIYTKKYKEKWDQFVEQSRNGTIFHTRKFLSYHPPNRFEDFSLLFLKDGNIMSVLPACIEILNGRTVLASHKGSTYGGFVIPFKFGIEESLYLVETLQEFLYKEGFREVWMRYPEYIFELEPAQEIKFAMWYKGFRLDYIELSTCYSLERYDESKPIIRQARRSYDKGVKCIYDDNNFEGYYNILYENLKTKYNREPTHTLEEVLLLKKLLNDSFVLVSVYLNNELIGGIVMFIANKKAAHIFYSAVKKNISGIFPNDALVDTAIRKLKEKGFKYLNYGISTEDKGRKINFELFRFKEKFKGFGVYREVWRYVF
ncbi:hypothetical protein [Persephonella sp.]